MNLIFCKGRNVSADYYTDQLVQATLKKQLACHVIDYNDPSTYTSIEFQNTIASGDCAAILFEDIGLHFEDQDGRNLWQAHQISVYSFLLSNPTEPLTFLENPPAPLKLLIPDQTWEQTLHKRFPAVEEFIFLPGGGTFEPISSGQLTPLPIADRDIGILCAEDCEPDIGRTYPEFDFLQNNGVDFFTECIRRQIENPDLYADAVIRSYFSEGSESCSDEHINDLINNQSSRITRVAYRFLRQELIRALEEAGLTVEIYGSDWESPDYIFRDNIHLHPKADPAEINRLTGRAKLTLHFMPGFLKGTDIRFFDILQNGSVCIATTNEYTDRRFKDGIHMIRFDRNNPNQTVADIKYLLSHTQRASEIASKGFSVSERDTWEQRLNRLLNLINA